MIGQHLHADHVRGRDQLLEIERGVAVDDLRLGLRAAQRPLESVPPIARCTPRARARRASI